MRKEREIKDGEKQGRRVLTGEGTRNGKTWTDKRGA